MTDSIRHTHKQAHVIKWLKLSPCFLLKPGMGRTDISPKIGMIPTTIPG